MKPSEMWEGPNSPLQQAYEEAIRKETTWDNQDFYRINNQEKIKKHLTRFFMGYKPVVRIKDRWRRNIPRYMDVAYSRYKDESYGSIAERLKLSRARIQQLEISILQKAVKWHTKNQDAN